MKRQIIGLSDKGVVRPANQDSYFVDDEKKRFCIVADGMGGHAGGEEASRIATKTICTHLQENWHNSALDSEMLLKGAVNKANQDILKDQQQHPERGDMGTTVVVLIFREGQQWCAHVGDSRLYRFRGGNLEQITDDHTWVGMALKKGEIDAEQAKFHPWRHVLSQCLGREDLQRIDIQELDVKSGDRLLVCSDGLTEEVSDGQIKTILANQQSSKRAPQELIDAAKAAGGSDNITIVIVEEE